MAVLVPEMVELDLDIGFGAEEASRCFWDPLLPLFQSQSLCCHLCLLVNQQGNSNQLKKKSANTKQRVQTEETRGGKECNINRNEICETVQTGRKALQSNTNRKHDTRSMILHCQFIVKGSTLVGVVRLRLFPTHLRKRNGRKRTILLVRINHSCPTSCTLNTTNR